MKYGEDYKSIPVTSLNHGEAKAVRPDVYVYTDKIVNLVFIGRLGADGYVIVDTGMPNQAETIIKTAKDLYGQSSKPKAIILTHGHFDHVGNVIELIEEFDAPVYIHQAEIPYVTGEKAYPDPDPSVEGGMIAKQSFMFPVQPIDLGEHVHALPPHGEVPGLQEFEWIHVPGHTPGQIALFRARDRLVIAADVFVTTKQENLYQVFTQEKVISGPPAYLTPDWKTSKKSLLKLQELKPEYAITGHGVPMVGKELQAGLEDLIINWDEKTLPDHGKFVENDSDEA